MATLLVAPAAACASRRVSDPADTDGSSSGALLPGPDAPLAGPTFEEWLDSQVPA